MKKLSYITLFVITGIFLTVTVICSAFHISFQTILTLPADTESKSGVQSNSAITNGLIDINSASAETLQLLPGIGSAISQRIVDYRAEHGPFKRKSDLLNVKGIGESVLNRIAEYITLGG